MRNYTDKLVLAFKSMYFTTFACFTDGIINFVFRLVLCSGYMNTCCQNVETEREGQRVHVRKLLASKAQHVFHAVLCIA